MIEQAAEIPLPSVEMVATALVMFLAGASCPAYYAQERMRGFGRAMMDRLPYRPPPGLEEEQALRAAIESAEEDAVDGGGQ